MISSKLDNVYEVIWAQEGITAWEISKELGYSYKLVLKVLEALARDKEVIRIPKRTVTRYYTLDYIEKTVTEVIL